MKQVGKNDSVKVHYTCTTDDGMVFSSTENNQPLQFVVGEGNLLESIEDGVIGMKLNETKTIKISHEKAYGAIREELIHEIDKELLPKNVEVKEGLQLTSKQEDGAEVHFRVTQVMESSVVIDANHPLAGKDLKFEIELIEIL